MYFLKKNYELSDDKRHIDCVQQVFQQGFDYADYLEALYRNSCIKYDTIGFIEFIMNCLGPTLCKNKNITQDKHLFWHQNVF